MVQDQRSRPPERHCQRRYLGNWRGYGYPRVDGDYPRKFKGWCLSHSFRITRTSSGERSPILPRVSRLYPRCVTNTHLHLISRCANLIVTGGGSAFPSSDFLVPIPGAWGANDAGVNINIYSEAAKTMTTYEIPGPAVWCRFLLKMPAF